jgi:hypothetical protein
MGNDQAMATGEQSERSHQASYTIPATDTTEFATLSQKAITFCSARQLDIIMGGIPTACNFVRAVTTIASTRPSVTVSRRVVLYVLLSFLLDSYSINIWMN